MIAHGILLPEFTTGLGMIDSTYTREPYYKDDGKQHIKLGTADDTFCLYNARDAAICPEAFPQIMEDTKSQGNEETYKAQRDLLGPILYMQERGVRIDIEGIARKRTEVKAKIEVLEKELREMMGEEINYNSTKQLQNYFYIEKKINPYHNRKTGAIAVDKNALKRISRKGFKEAGKILEIRKLGKLASTYLDIQFRFDNRLCCSYNPVGTKFSRLSSSKNIFGEGTNMQNLDYALKPFMLADKGYAIFDCDLSQAENRMVAHIAPDENMMNGFNTNTDVHSLTGAMIANKSINDVIYEHNEINRLKNIGQEVPKHLYAPLGNKDKSWRFWGKKSNHAFNYGWGANSFSYEMEMPVNEGKLLREKYLQSYPGVPAYWRWVQQELHTNRRLTNMFGRVFEFRNWDWRGKHELYKMAYSYIPQSTTGDIINRRGLNYIYYNQDQFAPVELLMQVHDSIVFQIPISIGWKKMSLILMKIKQSLETPLTFRGIDFIVPAGFKMGTNMENIKDIKTMEPDELEEIYNDTKE